MDSVAIAIFAAVYLGMMIGCVPGLAIDRTGIALLGAIALLATGRISTEQAWLAVDVPTIGLLFALMVVSAQLRLGGLYTAITRRIGGGAGTPERLLAALILTVGALSALLANDIVCLAVTPLIIAACARRKLNPLPFLLALACAANIGSAATLIGNPQNMLIGQKLHLSFAGYLLDAGIPAVLGLFALWWLVCRQHRGKWERATPVPAIEAPPYSRSQSLKGLLVVGLLIVLFLAEPWPREVVALAAAGFILLSRRMATRQMLGQVDWQLLVLFAGLFIVHAGLEQTGAVQRSVAAVRSAGIDPANPISLFVLAVPLSNLVSNVPAVMLLLPVAEHPRAGAVLALSSTLAGNLLLVGSIANLIVAEQAARLGIRVSWRQHARLGVPVTLATLAIAAAWLFLRTMVFD